MAIAGQLEVQIVADVAHLRTDLEKARVHMDNFAGGATRAIGGLTRAFSTLAGVGIGAFGANLLKSSIDAQASLQDLSERTSIAVETLSGLQGVARLSGTGMDQVGGAAQKLAKNMATAASGSEKTGAVFKQLGVEVKNADGSLRNVGDVFIDVARVLSTAEDQTVAVAYAQELLGKSGAELMPLMKDLAEQGSLQAITTKEQAEAADQLQKDWARLSIQGDILKNTIANAAVPALSRFVEDMNAATKIAGSLSEALRLFVFNLDAMTSEKPAEELRRLTKALEDFQAAGSLGKFAQSPTGFLFGGREDDLKKQIEFLKHLQRQDMNAGIKPGEVYDA
ncbi:MAG TPA: hypothetical protein VJU83_11515, partial [Burkholderiales bacterium]|nr:hypothetical protein [Burkholderiales bacterium]